ncbi:hypothetical protein ONS95_005055 [Cadophora gregata]|uniref:uncharacterized protein n=1 Tax=Cadophora gregata TaxID=51156 RepID=UPI0026DD5B43|nr:uncharacterized protein ONS95_005055 [Cadophora gregata]KAK0104786.1 hypothetical protein ONS95_005055 [Cadophora gregata]KAK0115130.1 hypothetical protein ONS96_013598 [Cadophora gregata f. sp. sojae]
MSRIASRRLLAQSPLHVFLEASPAPRINSQCLRQLSTTTSRKAEGDPPKPAPAQRAFPSFGAIRKPAVAPRAASPSIHPKAATSDLTGLADMFSKLIDENKGQRANDTARRTMRFADSNFSSDGSGNLMAREGEHVDTAWQLHIYATRHNVHITLVRPPNWYHPSTGKRYPEKGDNRTVALSLSAGNLGFRKSGRKHYDSAFQLASYVMSRMQESGLNSWIKEIEVFLRGFGAGREAVTKALLGTEGRYLRGKVVKVSDATRLKFGGTRSKKPRRLG